MEHQAGRLQKQKVKEPMAEKNLTALIFFMFFASIVILISGCQTQFGQFGKIQEIKPIIIHKGTQGLDLNFVQKMPPESIREGTTFNVGIEIKNKGSWSISNAKILISGYDDAYMRITGDNSKEIPKFEVLKPNILYNIQKMDGKSTSNLEGGYILLILNGKNIRIPASAESYESNIIATTCYGYETEATQDVCIDPFANEQKQISKPCTIKDYSLSGGQGGPVGVTKIDESILGFGGERKVEFKIYADNLGKGQVANLKAYSKTCSIEAKSNIEKGDLNIVEISATLGGKEINCYKTEEEKEQKLAYLVLEKDKNYVVCKTAIDSKKIYVSPLVVKLKYGYVESVSKKMEFKK